SLSRSHSRSTHKGVQYEEEASRRPTHPFAHVAARRERPVCVSLRRTSKWQGDGEEAWGNDGGPRDQVIPALDSSTTPSWAPESLAKRTRSGVRTVTHVSARDGPSRREATLPSPNRHLPPRAAPWVRPPPPPATALNPRAVMAHDRDGGIVAQAPGSRPG